MKNKNESKNLLKVLIDLLWYGSLFASVILVLVTIAFNLSAFGLINIKTPVVSVELNHHAYRFNSQYVEARRIDSIIDDFVDRKLASELYFTASGEVEAIEQLYGIVYSKFKSLPIGAQQLGGVGYRNYADLMPVRYFSLKEIPQFAIGLSFLSFTVIAFLLIIMYSVRGLFKSSVNGNSFSQENANRLKYIGIYFLLGEIVRIFISYWVNNSVTRTEWFNAIRQSYNPSFSDINFALLFAGVIFLILSKVFQLSAAIKEENDLTV